MNINDFLNYSYVITTTVILLSILFVFSVYFMENGKARLIFSIASIISLFIISSNMFFLTGTDRPMKIEVLNPYQKDKEYKILQYFADENKTQIFLFLLPEDGKYPLNISIPYSEKTEKELKKALKKQMQNTGTAKLKLKKKHRVEKDITPQFEIYNERYNREVPLKDEMENNMVDENFGF